MNDKLIINMPVANVSNSTSFFKAIGLVYNQELSDDQASCFTLNTLTTIALLPNEHFAQATFASVTDTTKAHEVLLSICKDTVKDVDDLIAVAVNAGASELHDPIKANGLYGRSFSDPDGHQWNIYTDL